MVFRERLQQITSLVYPAVCVGCRQHLTHVPKHVDDRFHDRWCDSCWIRLPDISRHGCPKCGSFIRRPASMGDRCALCQDVPLRFNSAVALGNYQGMLKGLVLELKRDMNEVLALQLGQLLGLRMMQNEVFDDVDFLVPVPIHWRRRFQRGFHAAGVVAEGVRSLTGIALQPRILRCTRLAEKQGTLTGPKRFKNVRNAFALQSLVKIQGARIVIVDDVMTSGATLSELARMLLNAGAESAHCAVVARGIGGFKTE